MEILPGPLTTLSRAIEARLMQVMPPSQFTYQWLPAKLDRTVWDLIIRRCPSVSLEYVGFERAETAATLMGTGIWRVWLAVKNISSAEAALFGDSLAPHGALIVHQVAMVALHGMIVKGAGTVLVVKAEPSTSRDRDDPGIYVICLTLAVERLNIAGTAVLTGGIASPDIWASEEITWSFGDSGEVDQVDIITNTGTL
jgi:hypothetical protein